VLENVVVEVVREVIRSIPNLQSMLKELIVQNMKTVQDDVEKPEQLEKEITALMFKVPPLAGNVIEPEPEKL